jgi:hypothetical protein
MLIIVEGVDGSGKSTLIQKIRENIKKYFWIMKSSQRPKSALQLTNLLTLVRQGMAIEISFLFDRFPLISEQIYGPILRDFSIVDLNYEEIGRRIKGLTPKRIEPLIIHCRPPTSIIRARIKALPQMEGVVQNLDRLIAEYDFAMAGLKKELKVVTYDSENDDLEKLYEFIRLFT